MIVLSPVVAVGDTDLVSLEVVQGYSVASSVFGSLSVMATDMALLVVHMRLADSPLTMVSSLVSNWLMSAFGRPPL